MNVDLNGRPYLLVPVPERLVPVRAEIRQRKVAAVLAILSVVLFVLAGFDVAVGSLSPFDLACFAGAALAAHLVTLRR